MRWIREVLATASLTSKEFCAPKVKSIPYIVIVFEESFHTAEWKLMI